MRKIEFRGKTKTGEWVFGYLIEGEADGTLYIGKNNMQLTAIDPETVGQFIGFCDKNNNPIYEDDIILYKNRRYFKVVFEEGSFLFMDSGEGAYYHADKFLSETIEVVDNIFNRNFIIPESGKLVAELFENV